MEVRMTNLTDTYLKQQVGHYTKECLKISPLSVNVEGNRCFSKTSEGKQALTPSTAHNSLFTLRSALQRNFRRILQMHLNIFPFPSCPTTLT